MFFAILTQWSSTCERPLAVYQNLSATYQKLNKFKEISIIGLFLTKKDK